MSSTRTQSNRRLLSPLLVARLNPRSKKFAVWDSKQKGFCLLVQKTGQRSYYLNYSRSGKPRWLHIADARAIELVEARKIAAELMLTIIKGGDPAAERKAQRGQGLFKELAERYVNEHSRLKNKSWKQARDLVQRNAIPRLGNLPANAVTREDVKKMFASIESSSTANQTLAAVSAIFTFAIKESVVTTNPCKNIDTNPTSERDRVLSDSELRKVWPILRDQYPALALVLVTAQRIGEVARIRRDNIRDGWWELPAEGTKNKRSHRVWLSKPAQEILSLLPAEGSVFDGERTVRRMQKASTRLNKELEMTPPWTPHDLRRTGATTIASLGFGRQAVDRILNHADHSVGSVYDRHGYAEEDKRIMEAVARRIVEGPSTKVIQLKSKRA